MAPAQMRFAGCAGVLLAVVLVAACVSRRQASFSDADRDAITSVLHAQRDAWNAGDIEGFMAAYVKSDELVFTSGGKVRRGYAETLARYRDKYVDGGAMGRLSFTDLEVTGTAADSAVVLGRWTLVDTPEAGEGIFSLVFVRRDGTWKIVHDHTSASQVPPSANGAG